MSFTYSGLEDSQWERLAAPIFKGRGDNVQH